MLETNLMVRRKDDKPADKKQTRYQITGRWILKSEPWDISWSRVVKEGEVVWDGVRNFQANNCMKEMKKGDLC